MLRIDALAEHDAPGIAGIGPGILETRRRLLASDEHENCGDEQTAPPHAQLTRMHDIIPLAWCSRT